MTPIIFLKSFEDIFFFIVNVSTVSYAMFKFYRFGNDHDIQGNSDYVEEGWSLLYRKRLEFDAEYEDFFAYITSSAYWLVAHCVSCELVRYIDAKKIPVVHAVFGILYLLSAYEPSITATSILASVTFYLAMQTGKKRFVWLTLFSWLCIGGLVKSDRFQRSFIPENLTLFRFYATITIFGWQILRLTSFAVDYCDALESGAKSSDLKRKFSLINFLGFGFYLPVLSRGPLIIYSSYLNMVAENESAKNADLLKRAEKLLLELVRLVVTGFVVVFMMHFLYTDAVIYDPYLLGQLKGWPLYGMIIAMMTYYTWALSLQFQMGGALSRFDLINAPPKPKCWLRLHKNSLTWRHLDKGLYDFLLKYIHIPISNLKSKWNNCGRFFVFIFITCWHCLGNSLWIYFWVWSNFGILYLEVLGQLITKSKVYKHFSKRLGLGAMNRINKLVGSQLLMLHICSSVRFISSSSVFMHLIHETYFNNTIHSYFILSLAMYSYYHVSDAIFHYEKLQQQSMNVKKTK